MDDGFLEAKHWKLLRKVSSRQFVTGRPYRLSLVQLNNSISVSTFPHRFENLRNEGDLLQDLPPPKQSPLLLCTGLLSICTFHWRLICSKYSKHELPGIIFVMNFKSWRYDSSFSTRTVFVSHILGSNTTHPVEVQRLDAQKWPQN